MTADPISLTSRVGHCRGEELVDYDSMLDRLAAVHPQLSRAEIEHVARVEHEVRYGAFVAVPRDLECGVAEVLQGIAERRGL